MLRTYEVNNIVVIPYEECFEHLLCLYRTMTDPTVAPNRAIKTPKTLGDIKEFIRNNPKRFFWVLYTDNDYVGYISIDLSKIEIPELGINIMGRYQDQGIGHSMYKFRIDMLRSFGFKRCQVRCREVNSKIISLATKFGFKKVDKIANFVILEKEL